MARHIHLKPHLSLDELARRYRGTKDPVERSRWHFLWLLARGLTATVIAGITGYWGVLDRPDCLTLQRVRT